MKTFDTFLAEISSWADHPDIKNNPAMQAKAKAQQARRQKREAEQVTAKKKAAPTQTARKEGGMAGGALARRGQKALPGKGALATNTATSKAAGIVKAKSRGLAKSGKVDKVNVKDVTKPAAPAERTSRPSDKNGVYAPLGKKKEEEQKKKRRWNVPLPKLDLKGGTVGAAGGDLGASKGHQATNN